MVFAEDVRNYEFIFPPRAQVLGEYDDHAFDQDGRADLRQPIQPLPARHLLFKERHLGGFARRNQIVF